MAAAHERSSTPETGLPPSPEVTLSSSDISSATARAWSIGEAMAVRSPSRAAFRKARSSCS